jgi:hypothetical protein
MTTKPKQQLTITEPLENSFIQTATPMTLIEKAMSDPNFDLDKLERLMKMQTEWDLRQARKDFFEALSKFQYECPTIDKNGKADFGAGKTKYSFATLDQIISQIKEPLKNCGLTYRFNIKDLEGTTEVTCVITHVGGHSESTTMIAGSDSSGSKNAIQAKGSTTTYLKRYTLIGGLGIVTADADDDGESHPNKLSDEVMLALKVCNNQDELRMVWDRYEEMQKNKSFIDAVNVRKGELKNGK